MLVGLIVIVESYTGEISGALIFNIGSCYTQQVMLIKSVLWESQASNAGGRFL